MSKSDEGGVGRKPYNRNRPRRRPRPRFERVIWSLVNEFLPTI
jgi:hypothetical protein